MPAERTARPHLKQTTLFSFAQRVGPTSSTGHGFKPKPSGTTTTTAAAHVSDDSDGASTPVKPKLARQQTDSTLSDPSSGEPRPKPKPKPKARAKKAGDEDRAETDVVLSIKPEFTKLISQRKKNHEYRKYKLKESVERLWLYETAPTSAITCVLVMMLGLRWSRRG